MSKRMKVLVSVLVAVVLLAVGITAVVMAQEEESPTPDRSELRESFLTRVADNLGVSVDELKAAIIAAQQEVREEALNRALDRAVEKERITQEEADEIREWLENKPEALDWSIMRRGFSFMPLRARGMPGSPRGWFGLRPPKLAD